VLALPLLVLLALNGLNLALILRHLSSGGGSAGGWLGLGWGGLTLLGLLVALRACRDPAAGDPSPWLALPLQATLRGRDPAGQPLACPAVINAVSESGIALRELPALPAGCRTEWLELPGAMGLPALPLAPEAGQGGLQLAWAWNASSATARERFLGWLYGRPGAWPQRHAPAEWRALLALLRRLISPGLQRQSLSLVPQQLAAPPARGTRDW
jgi:cellulose synthase (UDP-forming)